MLDMTFHFACFVRKRTSTTWGTSRRWNTKRKTHLSIHCISKTYTPALYKHYRIKTQYFLTFCCQRIHFHSSECSSFFLGGLHGRWLALARRWLLQWEPSEISWRISLCRTAEVNDRVSRLMLLRLTFWSAANILDPSPSLARGFSSLRLAKSCQSSKPWASHKVDL